MSSHEQHRARARGQRLAEELAAFMRRELREGTELTEAMLGAFDYFDGQTKALRDPERMWPEAPRASSSSSDSST